MNNVWLGRAEYVPDNSVETMVLVDPDTYSSDLRIRYIFLEKNNKLEERIKTQDKIIELLLFRIEELKGEK